MGGMGGFNLRELKKLQERLNGISEPEINAFIEGCAKELAARLLAKVIKRTPVGQYPAGSGKTGGTLRRGWTSAQADTAMSAKQYAESLTVRQYGGCLVIEIINPVEYASYVEFGHRTANHTGWVSGKFMMTISEQEIQSAAPGILERKISKFMKEHMP